MSGTQHSTVNSERGRERESMEKRDNVRAATAAATVSVPEMGLGDEDGKGNSRVPTTEAFLRIVPMVLCIAALMLMLKSSQANDFGSISYMDLGGFRYMVYANGICAGYSLLSAFYTVVPRTSTMSWAWTVFFFDQLLTYVILAAGTVSAEVVYLAYKGDESITWSDACGVFDGFCRKAVASVAITFTSVACYTALSLISSYRLFSNYDAPMRLLHRQDIEFAAFSG